MRFKLVWIAGIAILVASCSGAENVEAGAETAVQGKESLASEAPDCARPDEGDPDCK